MKGVKPISIPKKEAKKHWKEYQTALKEDRAGGYVREFYQLKRLYRAIAQGKKVIDIRECFKKAGWNKEGEPRLAIASLFNARKFVEVSRGRQGRLCFVDTRESKRWNNRLYAFSVEIPSNIMPPLPQEILDLEENKYGLRDLRTSIPLIPPKYLPKSKKLKGYYLLWEVKKWDSQPDDPILLKRVSEFAFVVLAAWDLTPLEKMVMR